MKTPPPTDTELAAQANEFHHQVISGCIAVIHAARNAGQALNAAKRLVTHEADDKRGTWQEWVRTHFQASIQTARVYMRIDRDWKKLEPELAPHAGLSLARALQILKVKPDGTEKEEPDEDIVDHCRRALCQALCDMVRDRLSPATVMFVTGSSGKFILESRFRPFREFETRLATEVDPIAQVFFEADKRRDAAGIPISPQQKEKIDATYVKDILAAFKGKEGTLTEYQKEIILEEIGDSKLAREKP